MTLQLHTQITMRESARWLSTAKAPTVTATVTGKRTNAQGGTTYVLEFVSNRQFGSKPVPVTRVLSDSELASRDAKVVKKARKPAPRKVSRTGKRAA